MLIYKLKTFVGEEFNFVRHQVICGLVVSHAPYDLEVKVRVPWWWDSLGSLSLLFRERMTC